MREITLRIIGTVCFVDGRQEDSFEKRLILPVDTIVAKPTEKHIPYMEFPVARIKSGANLSSVYQHPIKLGQIDYRRFELAGHVISIANVDANVPFLVSASYADHVANMHTVAPTLDPTPRQECFALTPDPSLIAGFLDIANGTLQAGPLYEFITHFQDSAGRETTQLQTSEYVDLVFGITSPDLEVTFTGPGSSVTIVLDELANLITLGNRPEEDISGAGSGDDITHHFHLYYKLADPLNYPSDPPLPLKTADPINSCTVTNWP